MDETVAQNKLPMSNGTQISTPTFCTHSQLKWKGSNVAVSPVINVPTQ